MEVLQTEIYSLPINFTMCANMRSGISVAKRLNISKVTMHRAVGRLKDGVHELMDCRCLSRPQFVKTRTIGKLMEGDSTIIMAVLLDSEKEC